jgi:hypothetical protein
MFKWQPRTNSFFVFANNKQTWMITGLQEQIETLAKTPRSDELERG